MTAFGIKAPQPEIVTPYAFAAPVRGCIGWFDFGHPTNVVRFKNLAAPLEVPTVTSPDPQAGYTNLAGKSTGKHVQTQIAETADLTVLLMCRTDVAISTEGAGAVSLRAVHNYVSTVPMAGLSFRLYANRLAISLNGQPSDAHVGYSTLTTWKLLALRIKSGDFIRSDNLSENLFVTTSQSGIARSLGTPFRLGAAIGVDTSSEEMKTNHISLFNRVLTDDELAVVASLVRARAAFVGITE